MTLPTSAPAQKTASSTPAKPAANLSPSGTKPTVLKGAPPFTMGSPTTAVSKWLKLLVYSRPGGGKTTLCCTAVDIPDMRDVLFLNADKGDMVFFDNDRVKSPELLAQNMVNVSNFKTAAMIHDFLKGHCKHRDENNEAKLREQEAWLRGCSPEDIEQPKKFKTIIIDSLTELDIYCTYGLLGLTQDSVLHGEASEIEVARFDEFRKNNQMIQMLCRAFRDLPIHVLATATEAFTEDELRKKHYMPQLTGQLRTQVPGFFDIVGHLVAKQEGDKIDRKMWVQPVGNFVAKNRRSVYKANNFQDPYMLTIMRGCKLLATAPSGDA